MNATGMASAEKDEGSGNTHARGLGIFARAMCVSILLIHAGCPRAPAPAATAAGGQFTSAEIVRAGKLANPKINEASGLAASRKTNGVLWTHNDSGNDPVLYAIGTDGRFLGSVWLAGADNIDWEDMASFTIGGRAYLLVADTGDNNARRKNCSLYVIEEPDIAQLSPAKELVVQVAWNVPILYPDKPHDCEAVAVDPGAKGDGSDGKIYLLTKRETPNRLFSVPLKPEAAGVPQIAWELGKIALLPQTSSVQNLLPVPTGRFRGQPTGMDFSPDGRSAVVLTYGNVLLYARREGESWFSALVRNPLVLPPHKLGQAEAACFSSDGKTIFVTEENKNAALLRYDLK
ncbi:hypothetical protein [Ereboglobus luteus]|uniref:Uncharacterized protein n=1 Tax=Ereboglobus luteus TaxID=1796921 RepID=A0A2U8E1Y0_9BACT|nr:hypothetical protein [Ereboglobus luteus]AWI08841.1 hypothetical protein CKA38_05870 [Ereboglobus luteus]